MNWKDGSVDFADPSLCHNHHLQSQIGEMKEKDEMDLLTFFRIAE